ncbi:MAG: molybdate ABC transporter substrate-binding protein [Oscillospiraceae bacterium]|nr:molybdate ABC transporter substrate-binding protein [Oscillospiraceae bacterium]
MKRLNRLLSLALACALALALAACGGKSPETELVVFAAASMKETLTEIGGNYMKDHPEITLSFNFDSSGTLKTQIEEGAVCDAFISAGQKQMNELAEDNYILTSSRFDLLENKVALAVPDGNPAGINSYGDLKARLETGDVFLAMGNSDVPVGQYTQKILAYYGLDEAALAASGCITYGSNVKEVTAQVSESVVDCGIVYGTDAFSAGLTVVDTATEEMCGQVIYPAAVLQGSEHTGEARAFLDYVRSPAGAAVLEGVGFTPLG